MSPYGDFSMTLRPNPSELEARFVKGAHLFGSFLSWSHWTSFSTSG